MGCTSECQYRFMFVPCSHSTEQHVLGLSQGLIPPQGAWLAVMQWS